MINDDEFKKIIQSDNYLVKRKNPSQLDCILFLQEVNYVCPLCGKLLKHGKQKKDNKLYEIAHIYPNSPTKEQYETLKGLERLGKNSEDLKNKIALCKDCHDTQDYHTTKEDYLNLLKKKKHFLQFKELKEATITLGLEDEITIIVNKLSNIQKEDIEGLVYTPVKLTNKFLPNEYIVMDEIQSKVTRYYTLIREQFKNIEGKNNFTFETLAGQIRSCFVKMNKISDNKEDIFRYITNWIKEKTCSESEFACQIIVSFFVQNCEVFNEITE